MKRVVSLLICLSLLFALSIQVVFASDDIIDENEIYNGAEYNFTGLEHLNLNAKSAVLMDAETGAVLYQKNENEALPPASVTKIMTLLLVSEALRDKRISVEDKISISSNAASMGGSQIFLEEGEEFTVLDLLKSTVIASANDAAVALAEHIAGSEENFVSQMNKRAKELGLKNTSFENATGLDDTVTNHLTSAYDIALMSRELIKYDVITRFSSLWQDSVRNGEFTLTNTNRLVRYYSGCTGLKTGSTDKAGFCVSATAKRGDMHLIAVIMGAETRDIRNNEARMLLDYGFSCYSVYKNSSETIENIRFVKGKSREITLYTEDFAALVSKGEELKVEKIYDLPEEITAPVKKGQTLGYVRYMLGGKEIGKSKIICTSDNDEIGFFDIFKEMIITILTGK